MSKNTKKTAVIHPIHVRQGDVLLTRVGGIPQSQDFTDVPMESGLAILAKGEVTGHHHSIPAESVARFVVNAKTLERFIQIKKPTRISHQEHAEVVLEPGTYSVGIQREYVYGTIRTVAD